MNVKQESGQIKALPGRRLAHYMFAAAGISAFSLVLFLGGVIWREPTDLFGFSPLRALTFVGLFFLTMLFLILAMAFLKRPDWRWKVEQAVSTALERAWLRDGVLFTAGLFLVLALIPLLNYLILQSQRFEAILFRYSWLIFLITALAILAIYSGYFTTSRRRWLLSIGLSILFFCISLLLQTALLDRVEDPYLADQRLILLTQVSWAIVIWIYSFWLRSMVANERLFWLLVLGIVTGLYLLDWTSLVRKLSFYKPALAFYAPAILFGAPLLVGLVCSVWKFLVDRFQGKAHWVLKTLLLGALIYLAFFYYRGALEHAQTVNVNQTFSDQNAYLSLIKTARKLNFHYSGDQNRMPGYFFLQALFYNPKMSDSQLFEQGKRINIGLSIILLACLFLIFLRYLSFYQAYLLLLIVAFSLYIFKAPYIQAEIGFYFLFFLSFVLMIQMLIKPGWLLGIAVGSVAGLGYLTKGTILPALALFAGICIIKETIGIIMAARPVKRQELRQAARRLAAYGLVLVTFWVVIHPYASQMKQRFGNYFYNVNTSIYIWYDEMEQAYQGEARYHFAEGVPADLPADQIPSLRKYLREHTAQQIYDRFTNGVWSELRKIGGQFSVTNYQLAYLWIFSWIVLMDVKNAWRSIRKRPFIIAFVLLFFLGYLAAFAWYTPIAGGRRFTYSLYIPFLFSAFIAINQLGKNQMMSLSGGKLRVDVSRLFTTANLLIALTLFYNIWLVLTTVLFIDRYGS